MHYFHFFDRLFMTRLHARLFTLALWAACTGVSAAGSNGLQALESFLSQTQSGKAEFSQTVQSPAKQGEAQGRTRLSSGVFEFARPNRFKFLYKKPFEQNLISDGQTLWLHDVDLNQVSTKKLGEAINGTPAVLIAAGADLKKIQSEFDLAEQGEAEGLIWLKATPKSQEGALKSIELGFKRKAGSLEPAVLTRLRILDQFGQRSLIVFSKFEINPAFSPAHFGFTPPKGADVVR
jgi:outer membrane lipoprotein carrier protein